VRVLLYLSGEPGAGKSALMAELTRGLYRVPLPPAADAPARDFLRQPLGALMEDVAVELGRRRDSFSGTDALPQTAITAAEAYLRSGLAERETSLLLAEGARLANGRFLRAAIAAAWTVTLIHLDPHGAGEERRAKRAAELGKPPQDPSWVKGRATAARNLAAAAPAWGVEVLPLNTSEWSPRDLADAVRLAFPALT
jgi:hypothetical protein